MIKYDENVYNQVKELFVGFNLNGSLYRFIVEIYRPTHNLQLK